MSLFQDPQVFKTVLDHLSVGVCLVDRDRKVIFWNRGAEKISGYMAQDVLGRFCRDKLFVDLKSGAAKPVEEACQLADTMRDGQPREANVFLRHSAGHRVPVHIQTIPLRDRQNGIIGAAESFEEQRSATRHKQQSVETGAEKNLDPVTGVPDIKTSQLRLQQSFTDFMNHRVPFGLMFVHVDGLKKFRDVHGKDASRSLLSAIARTLQNTGRLSDFVGCWDGDHFLIIARHRRKSQVRKLAERMRDMVGCSGIDWWGDHISLTVSIGGVAATSKETLESLVEHAGSALERSMAAGGNRVTMYPEEKSS